MLTFDQYPAQFAKPTYGEEMHGDEAKPLVSIYIEATVGSANLETFKPGLQDALWKRPAMNDSARLSDNGELNDLIRRFPTAEPIGFEDEYPGYVLTVEKSDLFAEPKTWADVKVAKVTIAPEDGGTATVKFRCQMRGTGLEWWVAMMNRSASITLTPPKNEPLPADHPDAHDDDGDPFAGSDLQLTGTFISPDGTEQTIDLDKAAARAEIANAAKPAGKRGRKSAESAVH